MMFDGEHRLKLAEIRSAVNGITPFTNHKFLSPISYARGCKNHRAKTQFVLGVKRTQCVITRPSPRLRYLARI